MIVWARVRAGVESREMHFAAFRWEWESHLDMCSSRSNSNINMEFGQKTA
jgi:hypothetical protein